MTARVIPSDIGRITLEDHQPLPPITLETVTEKLEAHPIAAIGVGVVAGFLVARLLGR